MDNTRTVPTDELLAQMSKRIGELETENIALTIALNRATSDNLALSAHLEELTGGRLYPHEHQ